MTVDGMFAKSYRAVLATSSSYNALTAPGSTTPPATGAWGVWSLTMDGIDKVNGWIRGNASSLNVVPVEFVESSVALALVEEFNMARA